MSYLVDTNVWSELRNKSRADARVVAWASSMNEAEIFVSAVTIFELERGVLQIERRDPRKGARLRAWLQQHVLTPFGNRILPVDTEIARAAARLHVPDPKPERDALIGATALVRRLTVVTRNTSDFQKMGVLLLNPWQAQAP